ncbi:sensor histidine kinase [Marinomonas sp. MED121]|uniref:PAS domain-containing hybrid sensor histidine kinase/response regulator n=1 Tax=Marinomonas sp. MED121 TaxID=314277 RepID=UPI0000691057|nr:PAS domain-containing hybrid sensor histidine kinase/response regulator [Marinomonas sp. MED121]EAQ67336.1 sensor histidine kinase [Marinomonas sp. MED121]
MISVTWISIFSVLYIGLLFVIALKGDKNKSNRFQPYIYSLTLAIFCTSWAFYGTVQQSIHSGWLLAPTYFGAIILMTLGWRLMARIILTAKRENTHTIADFIATRYGHSRKIAVLVSVFSLIGIVPYIALQLKAVSETFHLITGASNNAVFWYSDPTICIAILMAIFSILFGTRNLDASEHHKGLMLAVSFESLVKLFAFIAVGIYAVFFIRDGAFDLYYAAMENEQLAHNLTNYQTPITYLIHALIGAIAIFALPRHFHAAVVEYNSEKDLYTARWLFPLYLLITNLFILPIALVGFLNFDTSYFQQQYLTLWIPLASDAKGLALLAYIGGLSAGTSMVIVASIALSTMLSNEILLPLIIRTKLIALEEIKDLGQFVIRLRRISIAAVLVFAFLYYRLLTQFNALSEIGLLSFVAVSQFAPALLFGLIWRGGNKQGAIWGMLAGFSIWFYCLVIPLLVEANWLSKDWMLGVFELAFLKPQALLGVEGLDPIVHGTLWSLFVNCLVYLIASLYYKPSFEDISQAVKFVPETSVDSLPQRKLLPPSNHLKAQKVSLGDLKSLLLRFLNQSKVNLLLESHSNPITGRLIDSSPASIDILAASERLLSSVIGAPAASLLLIRLQDTPTDNYHNFNVMLDEAYEVFHHNRSVLSSALQSISQGVCILDKEHMVIAWNDKFKHLYNFADDCLYMGAPIEQLVTHIAKQGGLGRGVIDTLVTQKVNLYKAALQHTSVHKNKENQFIEIEGNPMPQGQYIITYTDVTAQRHHEVELRQNNEQLEQRVLERTNKLSQLNQELKRANNNKTHFLAAAGHDLVQPLNSASLFASSLIHRLARQQEKQPDQESAELSILAKSLEQSLENAEMLLSELLEISKLDADIIQPNCHDFELEQVMTPLIAEFIVIAKNKGLELRWISSDVSIHSDPRLLRRILQNLLSNAIRYTPSGKILLGIRRYQGKLRLQVWDTGIGIEDNQIERIFDEFHRIDNVSSSFEKGLGLGLSIVQRLSRLLDHPIKVSSCYGKGSVFSLDVPLAKTQRVNDQDDNDFSRPMIENSSLIACIDNEIQIIQGMQSLLSDWGYQVIAAQDAQSLLFKLKGRVPDVLIIDYHLDHGVTGLDTYQELSKVWLERIPCMVITADYTQEVENNINKAGLILLKKPVKAMALRSQLNQMCQTCIS